MQRSIKKVAVLGSGVMGSRIACHFAGIGVEVLLLDMLAPGSNESTKAKERNQLVDSSLQAAIKSNPSPLYLQKFTQNISTGNFTDDIAKISNADWIIEVVVERLDIKKIIYDEVEKYRKPGTLVSSNTSGIPIHLMAEGRSEDFQKHFCGTHFFNPPRYLRLLEIIPTAKTDPSIVDFHMHYGDVFLGKTTVLCKDTPAFIANRVGVFSMMSVLHIMEKMELSIDEIESITGPIMGRPKSATFRTADVVGIDTLVKVANGVAASCPNDEAKNIFTLPAWLEKMVAQNWLGDKTGQGFFKKIKTATSKEILTLNLKTGSNQLTLTDNSQVQPTATFINNTQYYTLVSGSQGSVFSSTGTVSGSYGYVFPDMGLVMLNPLALQCPTGSGGLQIGWNRTPSSTTPPSPFYSPNNRTVYQLISSSGAFSLQSAEVLSSNFIFCRAKNAEYNYTANPTIIDSDGNLIYNQLIYSPVTYITTVGLYNDSNELLAVAKLSKPLQKDFTKETLVRVKLDY